MAQENDNFTREYPRTWTSTLQKHVTMTSQSYKSRTRRPSNANISPLTLQLLSKSDRHPTCTQILSTGSTRPFGKWLTESCDQNRATGRGQICSSRRTAVYQILSTQKPGVSGKSGKWRVTESLCAPQSDFSSRASWRISRRLLPEFAWRVCNI